MSSKRSRILDINAVASTSASRRHIRRLVPEERNRRPARRSC